MIWNRSWKPAETLTTTTSNWRHLAPRRSKYDDINHNSGTKTIQRRTIHYQRDPIERAK
jgi:hypothetical protein